MRDNRFSERDTEQVTDVYMSFVCNLSLGVNNLSTIRRDKSSNN